MFDSGLQNAAEVLLFVNFRCIGDDVYIWSEFEFFYRSLFFSNVLFTRANLRFIAKTLIDRPSRNICTNSYVVIHEDQLFTVSAIDWHHSSSQCCSCLPKVPSLVAIYLEIFRKRGESRHVVMFFLWSVTVNVSSDPTATNGTFAWHNCFFAC